MNEGQERLIIKNYFEDPLDEDLLALAQEEIRRRALLDVNGPSSESEEAPIVQNDPLQLAGFEEGSTMQDALGMAEVHAKEIEQEINDLDRIREQAYGISVEQIEASRKFKEQAAALAEQATVNGELDEAIMQEAAILQLRSRMANERALSAEKLGVSLDEEFNERKADQEEFASLSLNLANSATTEDNAQLVEYLSTLKTTVEGRTLEDRQSVELGERLRREASELSEQAGKTMDRVLDVSEEENLLAIRLDRLKREKEGLKGNKLKAKEEEIHRAALELDDLRLDKTAYLSRAENSEKEASAARGKVELFELLTSGRNIEAPIVSGTRKKELPEEIAVVDREIEQLPIEERFREEAELTISELADSESSVSTVVADSFEIPDAEETLAAATAIIETQEETSATTEIMEVSETSTETTGGMEINTLPSDVATDVNEEPLDLSSEESIAESTDAFADFDPEMGGEELSELIGLESLPTGDSRDPGATLTVVDANIAQLDRSIATQMQLIEGDPLDRIQREEYVNRLRALKDEQEAMRSALEATAVMSEDETESPREIEVDRQAASLIGTESTTIVRSAIERDYIALESEPTKVFMSRLDLRSDRIGEAGQLFETNVASLRELHDRVDSLREVQRDAFVGDEFDAITKEVDRTIDDILIQRTTIGERSEFITKQERTFLMDSLKTVAAATRKVDGADYSRNMAADFEVMADEGFEQSKSLRKQAERKMDIIEKDQLYREAFEQELMALQNYGRAITVHRFMESEHFDPSVETTYSEMEEALFGPMTPAEEEMPNFVVLEPSEEDDDVSPLPDETSVSSSEETSTALSESSAGSVATETEVDKPSETLEVLSSTETEADATSEIGAGIETSVNEDPVNTAELLGSELGPEGASTEIYETRAASPMEAELALQKTIVQTKRDESDRYFIDAQELYAKVQLLEDSAYTVRKKRVKEELSEEARLMRIKADRSMEMSDIARSEADAAEAEAARIEADIIAQQNLDKYYELGYDDLQMMEVDADFRNYFLARASEKDLIDLADVAQTEASANRVLADMYLNQVNDLLLGGADENELPSAENQEKAAQLNLQALVLYEKADSLDNLANKYSSKAGLQARVAEQILNDVDPSKAEQIRSMEYRVSRSTPASAPIAAEVTEENLPVLPPGSTFNDPADAQAARQDAQQLATAETSETITDPDETEVEPMAAEESTTTVEESLASTDSVDDSVSTEEVSRNWDEVDGATQADEVYETLLNAEEATQDGQDASPQADETAGSGQEERAEELDEPNVPEQQHTTAQTVGSEEAQNVDPLEEALAVMPGRVASTEVPEVPEAATDVSGMLMADVFYIGENGSGNSKVQYNPQMPRGVVYKVQVGAFSKRIPDDLYGNMDPVMGEDLGNGLVRYSAGMFMSYGSANEAKALVRSKGYSDAFVVAFIDGKRVSIREAEAQVAVDRPQLLSAPVIRPNATPITAQDPISEVPTAAAEEASTVQPSAGVVHDLDEQYDMTSLSTDYGNTPDAAPAEKVETIKGLFFTVQVGVYSNPVSLDRLFNITPLNTELISNGTIRYTTGRYNDLASASARKEESRTAGVSDAFVTAYMNGTRITVGEAKALLEQHGPSILAR